MSSEVKTSRSQFKSTVKFNKTKVRSHMSQVKMTKSNSRIQSQQQQIPSPNPQV